MNRVLSIAGRLGLLCGFCLPAFAGPKVPISFEKFHGYTGAVAYLQAVHKAYPNITDLVEIGKSSQQRPMYVLVIANKKTGTTMDREKRLVHERLLEVKNPPITDLDLGKPGHLLTGCTHGDEQTGAEVCLYFIDKMVSGYGSDRRITKLIDNKVFYVCPVNNPDGLYNTVQKGIAQRTNSMLQTDTASAPVRKDLDGDGVYAQFRYKDSKGMWMCDSIDNRLMVRIPRDADVAPDLRYTVGREAEPDKGIDINRNFPEAWFKEDYMPGGTGEYATQAPEVHALCEFIVTHPNIIMINEYHTMGGHVYRPLGSAGDKALQPRDLAVYDSIMGKKYSEIMQEKMAKVWKAPYDEKQPEARFYGLFLDWLYKQYGMYSIVTELWNPEHDIESLKGLKGNELQRGLLAYLDAQKGQPYFLNWKAAKHPKHGLVEVGGWAVNCRPNNIFPGALLETLCERQWQFDLFRSELMPQMAVGDVTVKEQTRSGNTLILDITAEVLNVGALPTQLENTSRMAFCRGDVVWLVGENVTFLSGEACEKIGELGGTQRIPGFQKGENSKTIHWTVAVKKGTSLKVVASSLKGGTVAKSVNY